MARWRPPLSPWTVIATAERVPVWSNQPTRDDNWRFTDAAGHEHFYVDGYPAYPTVWIVDATFWCGDCEEEHEDGHYECSLCGEQVVPGTKPPSPYPTYIAGMTEITVEYDIGSERREYIVTDAAVAESIEANPAAFIATLDARNVAQPGPGLQLLRSSAYAT